MDSLDVAKPDLSKSFSESVKPAQQKIQFNATMNDPQYKNTNSKVEGINTSNTLQDDADLAALNFQSMPETSSILGDCLDQAKKLSDECANVVKPQLPETEQVMPDNNVAANNMNWTHKMDMSGPGGGMMS